MNGMANKKDVERKLKFAGGISLALGAIFLFVALFSPNRALGNGTRTVEFEVKRGWGAYSVSRELEKQGLLSSATFFQWLMRLTDRSGKIQAGFYELHDGLTASEIADILTEGRVQMVALTIPEAARALGISDRTRRLAQPSNRKLSGRKGIRGRSRGVFGPDS